MIGTFFWEALTTMLPATSAKPSMRALVRPFSTATAAPTAIRPSSPATEVAHVRLASNVSPFTVRSPPTVSREVGRSVASATDSITLTAAA